MAQITGVAHYGVDIDHGIRMTQMGRIFASNDSNALTLQIDVYQSGRQADLSGCGVVGYFVRADNSTVCINNGSALGGTATLTLPESCYAVEGGFKLVVKASANGGDVRTTIFCGYGYVTLSSTDRIIDPGHAIPSIDELLARIAEIEAATRNANSAAQSASSAAERANTAVSDVQSVVEEANQALSDADAAVRQAQAAATEATSAGKRADEAAETANSAADSATEAAQSANTATEQANVATKAATEAATGADEAAETARTAAAGADQSTKAAQEATSAAQSATTGANQAAESATTAAGMANAAAGAANAAAETANSAAQDVNDAKDAATEAASQATASAQKAAESAQTADTAAQNADVATGKANAAATEASEAAEAANDAAQAANEAATAANDATDKAKLATTSASEAAAYIGNITVSATDVAPGGQPTTTKSDVDGHLHITFGLVEGKEGKKGEQGAPNIIRGEAYPTLEALQAAVPSPSEGDQYNVGDAPPYHVYRYTGSHWEDQGQTQGPKGDPGAQGERGEPGERGKDGVTYTPSVSADGELSWTNNGSLDNPPAVNIRGPSGATGAPGKDGRGVERMEMRDDGMVVVTYTDGQPDAFGPCKGADGADGIGVGTITVTCDGTSSDSPTCAVTSQTEASAKNFALAFTGLKGAPGKDGQNGTNGKNGTRGSRWNSGTKLTGTVTSNTNFPDSGITGSIVTDYYLNTETGNVYMCTVAGDADTSMWRFRCCLKGKDANIVTGTASFPANDWQSSENNLFSQTVSCPGILASDHLIADLLQSGDEAQDAKMREAWPLIVRLTAGDASVTAYATAAPSCNIDIQLLGVRA